MREYDILHFDTNDNNSTFTTWNPYDTSFKLNSAYKNIKRITLKSLEMPIVFTNIRTDNTSNIINMRIGSNTYNITLDNKNYTSIQTLITDINNALSLIGTSTDRPIFSAVGTFIRISVPSPNLIFLFDSLLANAVLGFPKGYYNYNRGNVSYIQGTYCYNLNYDNFVALYLNIPSTNTSSTNHLVSYKIPLNAVQGMVFYLGQNNSFEQSIIISDQNYVLTSLRIQVFDRYGYAITQGVDYTFSLGFYYHNS
jgi:hypothetical protein